MNLPKATAFNRSFFMGVTGLTLTVTLSKDAAAFGAAAGAVTEISSGWYKIALTTVDTGTEGCLAYHATDGGVNIEDWQDQVAAPVKLADGVAHGGTEATLRLGSTTDPGLSIGSSGGSAVVIEATSPGSDGIGITGTRYAFALTGGSSSGQGGILIEGKVGININTTSHCLNLESEDIGINISAYQGIIVSTEDYGIRVSSTSQSAIGISTGSGAGLSIQADSGNAIEIVASGIGIYMQSDGNGIQLHSNDTGIEIQSDNEGISIESDQTALSIIGNADGVYLSTGSENGASLKIIAGASNSTGVLITGLGSKPAVQFGDGSSGAEGLKIFGANGANDINLAGTGDITASPTITGPATGLVSMMMQLWRRLFKKSVYDTNANTLINYADDGTTPVTTQTLTNSGGTQTQGPAI